MNYFKLYIVIVMAISTANVVNSVVDYYRSKQTRQLEIEKMKLEIELLDKEIMEMKFNK